MTDVRQLAHEIATQLIDWTYNSELSQPHCARVIHSTGARLLIRWSNNGWDHARISIAGHYPTTDNSGQLVEPTKRITASIHRGPYAIARDILRRFIPPYLSTYATADTLFQAYIARMKRRDRYIEQLATITTGHIGPSGTVHADQGAGEPWGTFEVYTDGTVQIELRNLDLETACDLATLVFPR